MPNDTATKLPAIVPQSPVMPLDAMQRLAESVAKSGMFGIKTPDQALVLMSIAQAEGRHPALAARDYHIIQGAPAKKAEAMARDFLSAGGKIEWHQLDDDSADATFSHPAGGSVRICWDQARVTKAGLGSNPMHKKYPRQMLRSRAVSEGVRTVWPMATSGMYVPEEVTEFARTPIDVTPRADLDRFAAPAAMDPETGEIIDVAEPVDIVRAAHEEAARGTDAFRALWKTLGVSERKLLRPDIAEYQRVAADADARAATDRDDGDDPFGLQPLPAETPNSPAAAAGEPRDLLGAPPAENLTIPLVRNPQPADLGYFARQLLALIAEGPPTAQRIARIRASNEDGLLKLKAGAVAQYDEIMAKLHERGQ